MADYGVTATGFVIKPMTDIQAEYEEDFIATFGAGINLEPESVNGQLIGIFAERDAELWEALADVYAAMDPDQASGAALDALLGITGTVRETADYSTGTALATGTAGTVLSAGRVFSVPTSGTRFVTTALATLAPVDYWAVSTVYALGDVVVRAGNLYYATDAGTSAGSGGPSGTGTAIVDGGVIWRYLGTGNAAVTVPIQAEETGPKVAAAWTMTTVETAVSGLVAITNPTDVDVGTDLETDADARARRELELQATGNAAMDAIRANVLQVEDVVSVTVFENTDTTTNVDGMPPHSVEAVVRGGEDEAVRRAVFASKAAGIVSHGNNSGTVNDDLGVAHTVKFSRPTEVLAYVDVVVTTDATFPTGGVALIKDALVAWADAELAVGDDVVRSQLYGPVFSIPGVVDVTTLAIGTSAWPSGSANLVTTARQLAVLDTGRIRVNGA